jgi:hypothetical protein
MYPIMNTDSGKSTKIAHTRIMKAARRSPVHVHDVAAESAVNNQLHESAYFIAKLLHAEIEWPRRHHECGMFSSECD